VGWLKTVDAYYYGTNQTITYAAVNIILTNVVKELEADPKKKFTYVEMKYFIKWYLEQDGDTQAIVKGLLKQGRLEIVNGGWSVHDEATALYEDMINNMYWGHSWLLGLFEYIPSVGWQIDPFGHSSTNARLFAEMGFDALFFARIDWQDRARRQKDKEMEFLWRPFFKHLGKRTEIFTHAFYEYYYAPEGFRFDVREPDEVVVDNPFFETYNADKKAEDLYNYIKKQRAAYQTDHILIPMGGDFFYTNAKYDFGSIDALMKTFN